MEQAVAAAPGEGQELMDVAGFREKYGPWMEEVRPLLEAKDWKSAFASYPFPQPATAPWTPFSKELGQCRVALLSTAGIYLKDSQQRFDAENIEGDWSFRELPRTIKPDEVALAHTHYDHASADADLNAVLPLDRLGELEKEGVIGELLTPIFSISGYCTRPDLVAEQTAPQIAARVKEMRADVLLNIPV